MRKLKTAPANVAARARMKRARAADPQKFRDRKNSYYARNSKYRDQVKGRIREKRLADPAQYLWEKAQRRAKLNGLEFTITKADIMIPKTCPVLGIPLQVLSLTHNNSPTIDRRDNTRGYVPGNVSVISKRANRIKNDATIEELEKLVVWLESCRDPHPRMPVPRKAARS